MSICDVRLMKRSTTFVVVFLAFALAFVFSSNGPITSYFQLGTLGKSAHPNFAELFLVFMTSKEAQSIIEKFDGRTTHLVEGTRLAQYLREKRIKLQAPAEAMAAYLKAEGGEGLQFNGDGRRY